LRRTWSPRSPARRPSACAEPQRGQPFACSARWIVATFARSTLFSGTRAIVDAYYKAWNKLIAETGRIQSLTDFG